VKRRAGQEREEADAREQAEERREALLAELKARESAGRAPESPPEPGEMEASQPAPEGEAPPEEADPAEAE
jgi:hypothetical protein